MPRSTVVSKFFSVTATVDMLHPTPPQGRCRIEIPAYSAGRPPVPDESIAKPAAALPSQSTSTWSSVQPAWRYGTSSSSMRQVQLGAVAHVPGSGLQTALNWQPPSGSSSPVTAQYDVVGSHPSAQRWLPCAP